MTASVMVAPFPADLCLAPVRRSPLRLPDATLQTIFETPLPDPGLKGGRPRSSVVIVTFNQLPFTRLCLGTMLANTPTEPNYEVIIVDNASTDGTVEFLEALASQQPRVRLVRNDSNRGFAPAVNQGFSLARGDVLVVLNNDTLLAPDWLENLRGHLADPRVGLVGPVTNSAPNEAQIDAPYQTYGGFERFARARAQTLAGKHSLISTLTMFCVAMRRDTYQRLGPLDERFMVGTFEDDDYSRRAREAGYDLVCAEDVFVHHFGQASFGELVPGGGYAALLTANRRRFEEKWGISWEPHRRRPSADYLALVRRIRSIVDARLPSPTTVLVTSKGDDALLELGAARQGWHFPRLADGTYAGYYPADSSAAIIYLEQARAAGAEYLLFPAVSLWWLDHYAGLRSYLDRRYNRVVADAETCWIYALGERTLV
jgi:GT2 family glycosyltransferase